MSILTSPYTLLNLELKNRVMMSPMCQYSVEKEDGNPTDWHHVHYVSRAVGGTGMIMLEATSVSKEGRISNKDLGLWSDEQVPAYKKLVDAIHAQGAKVGIQIGHAGRKATDATPPVAPSTIPLAVRKESDSLTPARALSTNEVDSVVQEFKETARRAVEAGFDAIEIHGAHGYLIHQFMSKTVNDRTDYYGEKLSNFGVAIIKAVKNVTPKQMPILMRMSALEYEDGGYTVEYALEMAKVFKQAGVDAFDVSSGGEGPPGKVKPGNHPAYQVPFARTFKEQLHVPVIAVGMLEGPKLAEAIVANEDADMVAIGRGMLKDPYWTIHAEKELTGNKTNAPRQYRIFM